jgi:hypothetical protein
MCRSLGRYDDPVATEMNGSEHPSHMSSSPPASMVGRSFRRHLATIPLWALRVAIDGLHAGFGVVALIPADVLLWVLHRRANRLAEQSPADRETFGEYNRWTKAFYVPEALAVALLLRDFWYVYQAVRGE